MAGLASGRQVTRSALDAGEAALEAYGIEEGATLRLAVGRDTAQALRFVQALLTDVGMSPPEGMSWSQVTEAARALAWLQSAVHAGERPQRAPPAGVAADVAAEDPMLLQCLRLSLGCYGHVMLRVLRVLPAWSSATGDAWTDLTALEALSGGGLDAARDVLHADCRRAPSSPGTWWSSTPQAARSWWRCAARRGCRMPSPTSSVNPPRSTHPLVTARRMPVCSRRPPAC